LLVGPSHDDPRPLILYHGRRCPDGFGASLAAWLYYGDSAEYRGLDHGEIQTADDLGDLDGRAVYVLDFAFEPELLAAIEARVSKLVVLDHHKSAAEKLTGYQCRCGVVHFDMNKSGARLAWEFFHPDKPVPGLIRYVEDRDIWKWEFPESPAFLAALEMEPRSIARWAEIAAFTPRGSRLHGPRRRHGREIPEALCRYCRQCPAPGLQRPAGLDGQLQRHVPQPGGRSAVPPKRQLCLHVACQHQGRQSGPAFALRVQLHSLAEAMGGGGHAQACGFKMGNERLVELLCPGPSKRCRSRLPLCQGTADGV
jgi:hypothetical protein